MHKGEATMEESYSILCASKEKEKDIEVLKVKERATKATAIQTERCMSSHQNKIGE